MAPLRVRLKKSCSFLPRLVFEYLGFTYKTDKSSLYKLYSLVCLTLLCLYPWSNLHLMLSNRHNFDIVIDSLFNCVGGYAAVLKMLIMIYYRKKLTAIFETIDEIQEERNTEEWSQEETYSMNKKMIIVMGLFYFALVFFAVMTLAGRIIYDDPQKWKTPIADVSFIDKTKSPNYEIAWMYQTFALTIAASTFCVSDLLIAAILVDVIIQFKILRKNMIQTFNNILKEESSNDNQTLIYLNQAIKQTVIRHLSLIELVNEIEVVFSLVVLIAVLTNLCVITFSLYYASVLPPLDFKAMQSYFEVTAVTMSIFIVSYCGNDIALASESIAYACYEINFPGADVRFQKNLMMIVMRSRKPARITVGGFAALSVAVFSGIIRSCYSYFMVLHKSNENNKLK